ncbi:Nn.00g080010.m01.CDS01 [Neocucurbitaria sp. VM-36]
MTLDHDIFQHTSLDNSQGCIRLLEILPQVISTNVIQCRIWHSTIDATYRCLSYVWGPERDEETILLNGKKFRCRKNLFSFLKAACFDHSMISKALWIDAICIDQLNNLERNQQVARMGDIYSRATGVIAWLGCDEKIAGFFRFATRLAEETQSKRDAMELWRREQTQVQANWTAFWTNAYWTRAWITQEVFLAKSIQIIAQDVSIGLKEFKSIFSIFPWISKTIDQSSKGSDTASILSTYLRVMAGEQGAQLKKSRTPLKRRLIELLHYLPFRESHIPRDHIYSLRAIAEDGYLIPVNYGSSDNRFAEDFCMVLPKSKSMCLCSLACIARVLPCDAIQKFPVVKFTMSSYSASRRNAHTVQSENNETRTVCTCCSLPVRVDDDQGHLLCLQQECSLFPGTHWSLVQGRYSKGCRPILKVITAKAEGISMEIEGFHIDRFGVEAGRRVERESSSVRSDIRCVAQITMYVRLHPLIRFTSHLEKSTGKICQKALNGSATFELLDKIP